MADDLEISGLWPIKTYIQKCQATTAVLIASWTIYELFMGAYKITGSSLFMRWRNQNVGQEVE